MQDRESYIALLVGAKYGISQIINSKLNIMSTLAEFANISRVELTEESEKVSMVKVYLQDVKVTRGKRFCIPLLEFGAKLFKGSLYEFRY